MDHTTRRSFLKRALGTAGLSAAGLSHLPSARAADAGVGPAMKFAICNETFQAWPFDKAFTLAAECGYTGIEVAPYTIDPDVRKISAARRTEIRRQAEKAKLQIIGLHWMLAKTQGFHLTSPDREVRRKTAEYLGELARFSADLGGKILVFGSPQQRNLLPGVSREEGMNYATDVFRAVLPVLEKTGAVLAVEPLSPKATSFISTAADGIELIRKVGSPRCRLHLDCTAMSTEKTPIPDLIRTHRADLVHFHANDANGQGPGFGDTDFVPILRALREIDYRGWVSVEVFSTKPGIEPTVRQSIRYMQKCLARTS